MFQKKKERTPSFIYHIKSGISRPDPELFISHHCPTSNAAYKSLNKTYRCPILILFQSKDICLTFQLNPFIIKSRQLKNDKKQISYNIDIRRIK